MPRPNPTPDHAQVLIHDLILAIQSSLDIAEETARQHYAFSVVELEVSASFDFEMTEQDSDVPEDKPQPKRWFSIFGGGGGKKDISTARMHDVNEKDTSKLTVRMLFRPGGKLVAQPPASSGSSESNSGGSAPAEQAPSQPEASAEKPK